MNSMCITHTFIWRQSAVQEVTRSERNKGLAFLTNIQQGRALEHTLVALNSTSAHCHIYLKYTGNLLNMDASIVWTWSSGPKVPTIEGSTIHNIFTLSTTLQLHILTLLQYHIMVCKAQQPLCMTYIDTQTLFHDQARLTHVLWQVQYPYRVVRLCMITVIVF